MPKLTDTQLVILSAAANREDRAVLPLPKSVRINKAAAARVLKSLVRHALVAERRASRDDDVWRETEDGQRMTLVITDAGRQAIDGGPTGKSSKQPAPTKAQAKKPRGRAERKTAAARLKSEKSQTAVRQGTKQALLIDLLKRKTGATIADLVKATGWQPHSVRGAISGALKKKLGLTVTSEPIEKRGRVYRIVGRG